MIRALVAITMLVPGFQEAKPEPQPADVLKALETKLAEAKTLEIVVRTQMPPGIVAGTLLFGEGSKALVDFVPEKGQESLKLRAVCDGARLKCDDRGGYEIAAPKELGSNLKRAFARMGTLGVGYFLSEEKGDPKGGLDAAIKVSAISLGAPEKVGDREAKVVAYKLATREQTSEQSMAAKLWIDASTGLPLKRTITMSMGDQTMTVTETISTLKLDEPVDAKRFEIPK